MTAEAVVELTVLERGIHCAGCESRIQGALSRLPGVREVKADQRTQQVTVCLDPERITRQEIAAALRRIGFEPAASP